MVGWLQNSCESDRAPQSQWADRWEVERKPAVETMHNRCKQLHQKSFFRVQSLWPLTTGESTSEGCIKEGPYHDSSDMPEQCQSCVQQWAGAALWQFTKQLSRSQQFWGSIYNWRAPGGLQACGSPSIKTKRLHLLTTGLFKWQLPSSVIALQLSEHWETWVLSGLLCHLCLAHPLSAAPVPTLLPPAPLQCPAGGHWSLPTAPFPPFPQDCLPVQHTDAQRFPLLVMCSHFGASIRLLLEGKVDFAFSVSTGGLVHCILMEEMMCQALLSSPLVLLGHTHVVLVLFLMNTFSHSWTSQNLCNFLLFPCILKPHTTPRPLPPKTEQNKTPEKKKIKL